MEHGWGSSVGREGPSGDLDGAMRAALSPELQDARAAIASGGSSKTVRAALQRAGTVLADLARGVGREEPTESARTPAQARAAVEGVGAALRQDLARLADRDPDGLRSLMRTSFGAKADGPAGRALMARMAAGDTPMPAQVRLVGDEVLGGRALGAYATGGGGTVYLHEALLGDPARLRHVLAEEVGHHLDRLLGGADAVGDEGAIFAQMLGGERLGADKLGALRAEDDRGVITLGDKTAAIEMHGDPNTSQYTSLDGYHVHMYNSTEGEIGHYYGLSTNQYLESRIWRHLRPGFVVPPNTVAQGYFPFLMNDPQVLSGTGSGRPGYVVPGSVGSGGSGGGSKGSTIGGQSEPGPYSPRLGAGTGGNGSTGTSGDGITGTYADPNHDPLGIRARGQARLDGLAEGTARFEANRDALDAKMESRAQAEFLAWAAENREPLLRGNVDRWSAGGADGIAALQRAIPKFEDAEGKRMMSGLLARKVAQGGGSDRFREAALDAALGLDAAIAVRAFEGRGGQLGRMLTDQDLAARTQAMQGIAAGAMGAPEARRALTGLLSEGNLDRQLDGEHARPGPEAQERIYRRSLAGALAVAYLPGASPAVHAGTTERLVRVLGTREGRELLAQGQGLGPAGRDAHLRDLVTDFGLDADAAKARVRAQEARELAGGVADGSTRGQAAERPLEKALGLDAGAAVRRFRDEGGRLGAELGDQDLADRTRALEAMRDGALRPKDMRRSLEALLGEGGLAGEVNGRGVTAERRERERGYRRELSGAIADAYLPDARPAQRERAAERIEALLKTPEGRELLGRARELSPAERGDLLEELAADPRIDAGAVEENTLGAAAAAALRNPKTWRAMGELALDLFPPTALALGAYEFYRALKSGEPGAIALAMVGFLPGPLEKVVSKMAPGALKMLGRRLDEGWEGPRTTKPNAQDPRLQRLYKEAYRPEDKFPGGSAGILLREAADPSSWVKRDGQLQPPHLIKAEERLQGITRLLSDRKDPIPSGDRAAAERVQQDLRTTIEIARKAMRDVQR